MILGNTKVNFRYNLKKRTTVCTIRRKDATEDEMAIGKSTCCKEDFLKLKGNPKEFKRQGRKLSMKRAISNSDLSKEERTAIWEAYRASTKVPRW